ncbi:MAG: hypothetical protein ACPL4N_03235 [Candidatus Norongarragalinales archaeon]
MKERERAQGAFEYIMLAGAVVLFLVVAVIVAKAKILAPAFNTTRSNVGQYESVANALCNLAGQRCPEGMGCYYGNGTCLPNLITNNPGFENAVMGEWTIASIAQRNNTHYWEGSWSLEISGTGVAANYSTEFQNVSGTFEVGAMAETNNGSCFAAVGFYNASYVGGACGAYQLYSQYGSTPATSWTPIHQTISLPSESCLIVTLGEGGSSCLAFVDSVYLVKVS